jgi:lipopolysaccharide export system protein LptA
MPPLPLYRLRRWLAAAAILFSLMVAGMYFYARTRQQSVLKQVPSKIGYDIRQTATGFQFSKSEGGRTLFTIRASDLKEFKLNGRAELRHVSILLYGRSSLRFDQIYGDDFTYDEKSGDIVAVGEVQMDLQANPSGLTDPDQAAPKELKNPIHIKTSDLVFNQQTGNASTNARADFRLPQATGWAVGVQYAAKTNTLTMASQVHVSVIGPNACEIQATHAVVTNAPREIVLDHPRLERGGGTLWADGATLYLGAENNVERVLARGNVNAEKQVEAKQHPAAPSSNSLAAGASLPNQNKTAAQEQSGEMRARSDEGELFLTGKQNQLQTGILTGNVKVERVGFQPMQGNAGRALLDFGTQNQVQKVHASEGVRLAQQAVSAVSKDTVKKEGSGPQDFEVTAPVIDFFVLDGERLDRAVTSGAAQIMIYPHQDSPPSPSSGVPPQRTMIQAGKFDAKFDPTENGGSRLSKIHGAPHAKIVSVTPDQPDRISTSDTADAIFLPLGGIESITQQGHVAYTDGQPPEKRTQAWSDRAHYTPADQVITLVGNPRVINGGMATTAKTIRINRQTNEAHAEDDVKSTYSELKEQPNGALLASSSPIHVTSRSMIAHNNPNVALYYGDARLWQDANIIEAPSIQFDRENRFVTAQGTRTQPVSTILEQRSAPPAGTPAQAPKPGKRTQSGPVAITSSHLTYSDPDRKAHYEGGVVARGTDFTASAREMDAYLLPRSQTAATQSPIGSGQLDHLVGQGNVVVQQPTRRADGQNLVYTAADDKFVLTGGPPSIFDAERGRTTGVSLTFFRRDDRVLVEGEASSPVVTQTRVAR